jgi:predicted PurR-regulated permease PerM
VLVAMIALREISDLVVPVLFGLFLALVAWPLVGGLERRGARHGVALAVAILVVLGVVLVAAGVAAFSVAELVVQLPRYEDRFREQVAALEAFLAGFGIEIDPDTLEELLSPGQILAIVRPVASAVSSAGLGLVVLAFTMIYALTGASSLEARVRAAFGDDHALVGGTRQFGHDLRRYLLVRAQLGLFAAVLCFGLLVVLGVPFPWLWAFLVLAASFIPAVGTLLAVIPPTILALLDAGVGTAVAVVVGYTIINFVQDHFLQPVVMGSELNLSPLVVLVSLLAWAWILGPAGALLAVPLTVGLVAILELSPGTRRLATLMRNRVPPPPPAPPGPGDYSSAASTS